MAPKVRPACIAAAVAALAPVMGGCGEEEDGSGGGPKASGSERQRAIGAAHGAYRAAVASFLEVDRGPCIAERLTGLPDWVVDIAHDPRRPVDDRPANQCRRYREGEASHFVELDPAGNLIRAR